MDLCAAITDRHLISFVYDGHQRIAIPAAYGKHMTTGNLVLRAYQTGGTSSSRQVPLWDLFLVEKMTNCVILDETFVADPPSYSPGDKHIAEIYCQL
ncbi:MAG: hypothetical protein ACLPUT_14110 [Solirubrobacteraceae bacterium]|jgi:hypothetical protein